MFKSGWTVRDSSRTISEKEPPRTGTDDRRKHGAGNVLLYELQSDPREKRNLAQLYPGMVEEMVSRVRRHFWDRVKPITSLRSSNEGKKSGVWIPWVKSRKQTNYTNVT